MADRHATAGSPPVIAIDSDEEDNDVQIVTMADYSGEHMSIGTDADAYFREFPFTAAVGHGDYKAALAQITSHVHGAPQLDRAVLPDITSWLDHLPTQPSKWQAYYRNMAHFWKEFATFTEKLLDRRLAFGDRFCDEGQSEVEIFYLFFKSYVVLCARLLQVDANLLSNSTTANFSEEGLLSPDFIRHLSSILRPEIRLEKPPLFCLLGTECRANIQQLSSRLLDDFLVAPISGLRRLLAFADAACHKVIPKNIIACSTSRILSAVGWHLFQKGQSHYCGDILHYFKSYSADLETPANQVDVACTRDLIHCLSALLGDLCRWDETIATEYAEHLLVSRRPRTPPLPGDEPSDDVADRAVLVNNAWKFRHLIKYVIEGRMELRVMSIGTMDNALVDLWRAYSSSSVGTYHPVMQFVAEFLLAEKVIDYIISVKSHPQLIQRSGNIVGFLVVSHRYSERHTDAIWDIISNNQNPRFVTATLAMLRSITTLMEPDQLLYLCSKLYSMPIESYSLDVLRFLHEIYDKLRLRSDEFGSNPMRPWTVCIRIMQDTPPSRDSTTLTMDLHREACAQLETMAGSITQAEREQIYRKCTTYIAERSPKATGAVRAIYLLCAKFSYSDAGLFQQDPDIVRRISEELCAFVKAENSIGSFDLYSTALDYRLEMLCFLILEAPEAIPQDLYYDIWHHTIGQHALDNDVRDKAWNKLTGIVQRSPGNEFCKQLISFYVPKLESAFFTQGLYEFVAAYRFPTMVHVVGTGENAKELIQIPAADLLWRMMMIAPQGTIESRAAELLVRRYVEVDLLRGATVGNLEDAHVALAEKCIGELLANYKTLRHRHIEERSTKSDDNMDISLSDSTSQRAELRFSRTIFFVKLMLEKLRSKPEFSRCRRSESRPKPMEPQTNHGDQIEVTYTASSSTDKKPLVIGTENLVLDLEARLRNMTGFTKLKIFFLGRQLNVEDQMHKQLKECGLARSTHMLVQDASGGNTHHPVFEKSGGRSVFELTILDHFEELFICMDSSDDTSAVLFGLLEQLPPPENIYDTVAAGSGSADSTFPPGKPFQAEYAAYALRDRLKHQLRKAALDETFLLNAVQLLDKAILNPNLVSDSLSGKCELRLASVIVGTLLEFLKERPEEAISSRYFSDEALLVDRLSRILAAALDSPCNQLSLVCNSYATILEASLHSGAIWKVFMARADNFKLHQILLLRDPRKTLRENIVRSIASICGGGLPITSPLTEAETAAQFWQIVSAALPEAVRYHFQSEQLLGLAEQLFRSYDEHFREEQSLRDYLVSWGQLLLQYRHDEFVGRGEVDVIVLGFTKLLLSCVTSLKSFKKSVNAVPLMHEIFHKFLFTPKITEVDDVNVQDRGLPVLESGTRRELYDLVHALAEDRTGFDTLLGLADGLVDDEIMHSRLVGFDRTDVIRSPTGYVGLFNPRALCYMNSLLTQLFMNINFRKFVLGLPVADPDISQRLLFEAQKLFANMQNSFRKAADPRDFAARIKGIDGLPIDLTIQMDADEFYNLLFDQMEGQLLTPQAKQQFRSFYGGKTLNQVKSKECEHVSERVEPFFVIQCDVLGKAGLLESLQAFVEGDVMEGENKYKCESCGGKFVDAVKRTCLKDVPDNLILHLKRFDFDLVNMMRTKINDLFPFPNEIDISAYHVDHLSDPSKPRQEDIFDLVGILVHQGTSENGHYYSYIRERPCQSGSATNWVEFNDREVDVFDREQIPFQAWGGTFEERYSGQQKQFSAYMLFYQRREAIESDRREYTHSSQREPPKVPIPPGLREDIAVDNDRVLREYCLHDTEHSKFVRHMLVTLRTINNGNCSEGHQQETKGLHIALGHLCHILARQRNIEYFEEIMIQLRKSLLSCVACCHIGLVWFTIQQMAFTVLLLRSPHAKVRSQVRVCLLDCMLFLRSQEPAIYYGTDTDMENATSTPTQGILVDIVQRLRAVADDSWSSSRGWEDFHLTLCQIARMGHIEVAVLLTHEFLEIPLKVFSMHAHVGIRTADPDMWRLVDKKKYLLSRFAELVYLLLSHMDIRLPVEGHLAQTCDRLAQYSRSHSKFPLTHREMTLLVLWDEPNKAIAPLDKMLETYDTSKTEIFYPGEILRWMLQARDQRLQYMLFQTVHDGITQLHHPWSDPYVRAAIYYLEGCPDPNFALQMFEVATRKTTLLRNLMDESWQSLLDFLSALPTLRSPALVRAGRTPDALYRQVLQRSRSYGPHLLLHENELVRKATAKHLYDLFHVTESLEYSNEALRAKYIHIRTLLRELITRFNTEKHVGASRSYLDPLIKTCKMLAGQLTVLYEESNPSIVSDEEDEPLLLQYEQDVVSQLVHWPQDEDTPTSTGGRLARRGSNASSATMEPAEFALDNWPHSEFETESEELDNCEP